LQFLGDDPRDWHSSHEGMIDFDSGAWRDIVLDALPALNGVTEAERRWFGIFGAAQYVAILEHVRVSSNTATKFSPAMEAVNRTLQRSRNRAAASRKEAIATNGISAQETMRDSRSRAAEADRQARQDILRLDRERAERPRVTPINVTPVSPSNSPVRTVPKTEEKRSAKVPPTASERLKERPVEVQLR
jgi:hypothetical protein